jgi:hypothetical protein
MKWHVPGHRLSSYNLLFWEGTENFSLVNLPTLYIYNKLTFKKQPLSDRLQHSKLLTEKARNRTFRTSSAVPTLQMPFSFWTPRPVCYEGAGRNLRPTALLSDQSVKSTNYKCYFPLLYLHILK